MAQRGPGLAQRHATVPEPWEVLRGKSWDPSSLIFLLATLVQRTRCIKFGDDSKLEVISNVTEN